MIGFGVNTKSGENGFVCVLIREPLGCNNRKQPVISKKPEIIDLSEDDDDMPDVEILAEKCGERVKNVNIVHSTSLKKRILERYNKDQHTQKCSVPLIRCDSENFTWPPHVKNSFLIESEDDEGILRIRKKRSKRLSSESSDEDSTESTATHYIIKIEIHFRGNLKRKISMWHFQTYKKR